MYLTELGKPREFWKKIKQQYSNKTPVADNLQINDLFEHFSTLYKVEGNTHNTPNVELNNDINNDADLDNEITMEGIPPE